MQMTQTYSHEELLAQDLRVEFNENMGKTVFVSHQWLGSDHPDPEFKQMKMFQDAFRQAMSKLKQIPVSALDEVLVPGAKALPTSALRSETLFLWYDYFSCPQMHNEALFYDRVANLRSQLSKAVDSIPAYLGKCSFFFALCPTLENTAKSGLISATSWAHRGWCCAERAFRELSDDPRWIMVRAAPTWKWSRAHQSPWARCRAKAASPCHRTRPSLSRCWRQCSSASSCAW